MGRFVGYVRQDDVFRSELDGVDEITTMMLEDADIELLYESEVSAMYDEMLDECYPEVVIDHSHFQPSEAMRELDPITYRCGFADYTGMDFHEVFDA